MQKDRPKRRIALVIHALYGGGAERVMSQLANRWSSQGHDVALITLAATSTDQYVTDSAVQRIGLDVMRTSRNKLAACMANRQRMKRLRATIQQWRPDRILSFCDRMNVLCLQACHGLSIPIWISERSDPRKQKIGWIWEWARRWNYPYCSGCVVQTASVQQYLARILPSDKLRVIPNAVTLPESTAEPTRSLHIEESTGKQILLSVGRLAHEKGFDVLLRAWGRAHSDLLNWILVLMGDGPERNRLEALARSLNVIDSVRFLGWWDSPWPAYARADLYVMPSRYEGFPMALLEAMSCGKPCIATRCSAAVDSLADSQRALLCVNIDDEIELAQNIISLAHAPDQRTRLSIAARQIAQAYSWDRIGPLWDQILL